MGEPPPSAMIVSGPNSRTAAASFWTACTVGSGSMSSMICSATRPSRRPSTSMMRSTKPSRVMVASVTIVTRRTSGMSAR